jgi:hypothetical protein
MLAQKRGKHKKNMQREDWRGAEVPAARRCELKENSRSPSPRVSIGNTKPGLERLDLVMTNALLIKPAGRLSWISEVTTNFQLNAV